MDKYEFNIKVEQIKKLVNKGDFETAMKIADTIDWRRVRSTSLLTMISQIYEKNAEYQDAKDILLLAYERAPLGKGLLYKLTDLALRENNIQEAEAYYREFCELSGDDPRQYLLRFLILEAKDAPLEQQINSLERYCQEELDEKWLYHLAELYHQANQADDCVRICDKIMLMFGLGKYVDKAMERYPLQMKIVVRFGIYQIEDRTIDVTVMYDRAVLAVKRIKGKYGEAYAYFDDSMRNELLLEKEITNSMQQALADGEFLVYLQPKCNLKTEEYVGAEALIRWMNPERGLLPPGQFIPIFEKTGFITEVDLYVWEQVCRMLARWKQENRTLIPISVNVSRADLYHSDFMDRILELMDKYDIEPSLLHMEITETVYTENQNQILDMVNQMEKLGFKVEMDDFGSGYSSLNMLTEIPVDVLKLDMRFLEGYSAGKAKGNILEFSVGLAKSLGLESVAEGVETREMVDELKRLNCEMGQGYYFSRPIPIHEFEQKFDKNQKQVVSA